MDYRSKARLLMSKCENKKSIFEGGLGDQPWDFQPIQDDLQQKIDHQGLNLFADLAIISNDAKKHGTFGLFHDYIIEFTSPQDFTAVSCLPIKFSTYFPISKLDPQSLMHGFVLKKNN